MARITGDSVVARIADSDGGPQRRAVPGNKRALRSTRRVIPAATSWRCAGSGRKRLDARSSCRRVGSTRDHAPRAAPGLGRALSERIAEWAVAIGADRVELTVSSFNEDATRLFEGLGFEPTSRRMVKNVGRTDR